MIDLQEVVNHILAEALNLQLAVHDDWDTQMLEALGNQDQDIEARLETAVRWLRHYGVLMGLNNELGNQIATAVINYADQRADEFMPANLQEIINGFEVLHENFRQILPRAFTSLTSKALWCCYPTIVPLYDSYAERALSVISRLAQIEPIHNDTVYGRFASVWMQMYNMVEIPDDHLNGYPYKVRIFDKILWILGQKRFR